jgi:hypothetical protein
LGGPTVLWAPYQPDCQKTKDKLLSVQNSHRLTKVRYFIYFLNTSQQRISLNSKILFFFGEFSARRAAAMRLMSHRLRIAVLL